MEGLWRTEQKEAHKVIFYLKSVILQENGMKLGPKMTFWWEHMKKEGLIVSGCLCWYFKGKRLFFKTFLLIMKQFQSVIVDMNCGDTTRNSSI